MPWPCTGDRWAYSFIISNLALAPWMVVAGKPLTTSRFSSSSAALFVSTKISVSPAPPELGLIPFWSHANGERRGATMNLTVAHWKCLDRGVPLGCLSIGTGPSAFAVGMLRGIEEKTPLHRHHSAHVRRVRPSAPRACHVARRRTRTSATRVGSLVPLSVFSVSSVSRVTRISSVSSVCGVCSVSGA